jgi:uncharacterized protein HemY
MFLEQVDIPVASRNLLLWWNQQNKPTHVKTKTHLAHRGEQCDKHNIARSVSQQAIEKLFQSN